MTRIKELSGTQAPQLNTASLSELSVEELESYAKAAKKVITDRQKKQRNNALHEILISVMKHQISLEEIVGQLYENKAIYDKNFQNGQPLRAYQNPDNPIEIWCGSGRQPDWLRERIALGQSLEDFEMFKELRAEMENLNVANKVINRCSGKKGTTKVTDLGEHSVRNAQTLLQMAADDTKIVKIKAQSEQRRAKARETAANKKQEQTTTV